MTVAERCGPTPRLVPFPGGDPQPLLRSGLDRRPGGRGRTGSGGCRSEAVHQVAVAPPGFEDGDLLAEGWWAPGSRLSGPWTGAAVPGSGAGLPPPSGGAWRGTRGGRSRTSRPRSPAAAVPWKWRPGPRAPQACTSTSGSRGSPETVRRSVAGPSSMVIDIQTPSGREAKSQITGAAHQRSEGLQEIEGTARMPPQRGVRRGGEAGRDVGDGHRSIVPRRADTGPAARWTGKAKGP